MVDRSAPHRQRPGSAPRSMSVPSLLRLSLSLAAGLCALATAPALAEDEAPNTGVWYQVEILLFENRSEAADTLETLDAPEGPSWREDTVILAPPWPSAIRPLRTEELQMLWDGFDAAPRLDQVSPGLDPETEALIRWVRRLQRRSAAVDLRILERMNTFSDDLDLTAADTEALDAEAPLALEPVPVPVPAIEPTVTIVARAPEAPVVIPMTLSLREVGDDGALMLRDAARRLARARDFRVLQHVAWRQPFDAGAPGVPIRVLVLDPATGSPRLVGTVAVDLRRFLHVELDLAWALGPDEEGVERWSRIAQDRRMRSDETHYLDHPRVGAVMRITPFELAAPLSPDAPPQARLRE